MLSEDSMHLHKKFAFDVGITFLASVITLPLGFVITVALGRYLGAGDLGLYRMTSTIYGIAMLVAALGIPGAMIKKPFFLWGSAPRPRKPSKGL